MTRLIMHRDHLDAPPLGVDPAGKQRRSLGIQSELHPTRTGWSICRAALGSEGPLERNAIPAWWVEGGADGVSGDLLQLAGYNGGEQEGVPIDGFRRGESSVLPRGLNNATPALSRDGTRLTPCRPCLDRG